MKRVENEEKKIKYGDFYGMISDKDQFQMKHY